MNRTKNLETSLVLVTALVAIYFFKGWKELLIAALVLGSIGILFNSLNSYVALGWQKLSETLGYVMSKLILGVVFLFFLFPLALISRIGKKDRLHLKKNNKSVWQERNHVYSSKDILNPW